MSLVMFIASVSLYILLLGIVLYFCVLADPSTSPTAQLLTETLPQYMWATLEALVGPKITNTVEFFADRFMLLTYCAVVFGSWSVIFAYIYPWIDSQQYLSHHHKTIGVAIFISCVTSWYWVHMTSPGIITPASISRYDHFPYDDLLYSPGRICSTRHVPRLARSKYDRFKYHQHIPRFDHFCGWVYNTIGEENYRLFLLFLVVHAGMCCYGTYCVGCLFYGHVMEQDLLNVTFFDKFTGDAIDSSWWIVFQYLFFRYFAEGSVFAIMVVMALALGLFLAYHVWLTSRGFTTNESYKWDSVQRWYQREMKLYNEAVRRGDPVIDDTTAAAVHVEDTADVTCTPGSQQQKPDVVAHKTTPQAVHHPGPRPVNAYNRGFIENWKEVLFPISMRKDRRKPKET